MPQRWYDHWYSYGHHLLFVRMAKSWLLTGSMSQKEAHVNRPASLGGMGGSRVALRRDSLDDQHGVAVRVEAIAAFDGILVCGQNQLATGEGRDQHQQG